MTTAHRPTWAPARGGEEQGGMRFFVASRARSAKDQPAQLSMKFRGTGQAARGDLEGKDLKAELEAKEREHMRKTKGVDFEEERKKDLELLEAAAPEDGGGGGGGARTLVPRAQDADDADADDGDDSSSSDDDDDEDDEAELMAELERIRGERAAEAERRAAEEEARREKEKEEALRTGNPLLAIAGGGGGAGGSGGVDFGVKRRRPRPWDEDVVFKNTTRGEVKAPRRFVNDTVRNDFHRRFLERYIK
ncbi:MAG: Pre-mRNA-splicing factor Cwf15/Cwc15 [Monoraphidium minutum]|nr:MAG: Pre-mRNA-splicing factor Cwf15/Cwc15 [Monoraphidium minutum]